MIFFLAAPLLLLAGLPLAAKEPPATLIFTGGTILTLDPAQPQVEALAVADGRILALGTTKEILALRGPDTKVIDLQGNTLLPSFKDHHLHLLNIGFSLLNRETNQALFLDLSTARSADEVARRVAARAAALPAGHWILGKGWNQEAWGTHALPTRAALDRAAPHNPVFLTRVDGHCGWANAAALKLAGITKETPDPPGGAIGRLPDGSPSGILLERANEPVLAKLPPPRDADITAALRLALRAEAAQGVTQVYDAGFLAFPGVVGLNAPFEHVLDLLEKLDDTESLPLQVNLMIPAPSPLADKLTKGVRRRGGTGRVQVTTIKLFADGALGSRGAALRKPYADDASTSGVYRMTEEEIEKQARAALAAGLDVATHAIGDAAVARTLDAYAALLKADPKLNPRRLRLEHFSVATPTDEQRAARLGILLVVQPGFVYPDAGGKTMEDHRLGPARSGEAYNWGTLEELGAHLAGSTDDFNIPAAPFWTFYAAVTRKNPAGQPPEGWHPAQRLSREAALRLCTEYDPPGGGTSSGALRAGGRADLMVVSGDPLTVKESEILGLKVRATLLEGRVSFDDGSLGGLR